MPLTRRDGCKGTTFFYNPEPIEHIAAQYLRIIKPLYHKVHLSLMGT